MKNSVFIIAILAFVFFSCEKDNDETPTTLTAQEQLDLIFLREEEKLARDVYIYSFQKYNLSIFSSISNSEQSHMDRVLTLLNKYDISDPIGNDVEGVFQNPDLQFLYDELTTKSDSSLNHALEVGATIEDLDISDIKIFINNTTRTDLLDTYENLTCGSRNHLRSFVGQLGTYTPVFITQSEYEVIINSPNEQCGN
jgi:hypothetical protein